MYGNKNMSKNVEYCVGLVIFFLMYTYLFILILHIRNFFQSVFTYNYSRLLTFILFAYYRFFISRFLLCSNDLQNFIIFNKRSQKFFIQLIDFFFGQRLNRQFCLYLLHRQFFRHWCIIYWFSLISVSIHDV